MQNNCNNDNADADNSESNILQPLGGKGSEWIRDHAVGHRIQISFPFLEPLPSPSIQDAFTLSVLMNNMWQGLEMNAVRHVRWLICDDWSNSQYICTVTEFHFASDVLTQNSNQSYSRGTLIQNPVSCLHIQGFTSLIEWVNDNCPVHLWLPDCLRLQRVLLYELQFLHITL